MDYNCSEFVRSARRSVLAAAILACSVPGLSYAQDIAGDRASADTDSSNQTARSNPLLEEVLITATRRTTSLQQTAVAVTPLPGPDLQAQGIIQPGDLAGLAPGIKFQPTFLLLTYVRGIGNYSSQPGVDQSIAYNVDGVYIDRPYGMPNILFDLERVELRRGPQGTIQGRNAIAGSIDLITAKPQLGEFDASMAITAGNYSRLTVEAMANIPITDDIALRVAAASTDRDGYMKNGFWDSNSQGIRVGLLAALSPKLDVLLSAEFTRRDELGPSYSDCPPGSTTPACAGVRWDAWKGQPGQGQDGVNNIDEENYLWAENYSFTAQVTYDMDFATLTWIPSFRHVDYRNHYSLASPFGYAPAVDDDFHYQELRIESAPTSAISWTAGLFYTQQKSVEQNYFTTGTGPSISVSEPGFRTIGHVYFKNDIDDYEYTSYSAFTHLSFPLTDNLRLTGGLRYTDDNKSVKGRQGLVVTGPTLISEPYKADFDLDKVTYKYGFEYDVSDEVMIYADVGTGFKSGGPNGVPEGGGMRPSFEPEEIKAYQAGIKSRFWDGRAQINAEAFYYELDGYQTSVLLPRDDGLLVGGTLNSQEARFYGAEIESRFMLTPNDQLRIDIAWLDAEHKKFLIPETGEDLSGKPVSNAPEFTFTLNYQHTFELANNDSVVFAFESRYEADHWVDHRLFPGAHQDSYWMHSSNLTYHSPDSRWSVGAFVRNITNEDALQHALIGIGDETLGVPYQPRTYGVRMAFSY